MKRLLLALVAFLLVPALALAWRHGPLPTPDVTGLTPSASWNGSLLSGFPGGVAPSSPTMPITNVTAGGSESSCGSTCIQLTVTSTEKFGATASTGLACAKYVQGAGEANGCWPYYVVSGTKLDLLGSTYANGTFYPANNGGATAIVGVAYGAQVITAVASDGTTLCNGGGCPKLTIASTSTMTTGDSFSAFNIGSMSGTWPIRVIDATHVALGTAVSFTGSISGTTLTSTTNLIPSNAQLSGGSVTAGTTVTSGASGVGPYTYTVSTSQTRSSATMQYSNQPAPPYTAFSATSISILANSEPVIGALDEHSGKVWEPGVSEYVTFGAVINNRNAISGVTCYLENPAGFTAVDQSANPNYPDDGYVFQIGTGQVAGFANGMASLFCDAVPVNGLARRQAMNIWIDSASADSSYIDRAADIGIMYVDTSNTANDSGACGGVGGKGTSPSNPYSSLTYASTCGKTQLSGAVPATSGGYIVKVANNILNVTATTGSSGTNVNLTANCPSPPATPAGNVNLQNYVLYDLTQGATVGTVTTCPTAGHAVTLAATAAVTVANADRLQFQSPEGNELSTAPSAFGNAKQIDVVPAVPATKILGISAYSGTSATLTMSARPANWTVGTKVLITGMYPNEYNGYYALTAVGANSITYTCCTIGGQVGYGDPKAAHPDAPVFYGQAVIPYLYGILTTGTWYSSASSLQISGGIFDMGEIWGFQPCGGGNCTTTLLQPYVQGLTFNNSAMVDLSSGPIGPEYGYYNYAFIGSIFATSGAIRVGNMEDVYYKSATSLGGAVLMRNVSGLDFWKLLNLASNFRNNTGLFAVNVGEPVSQSNLTGIDAVRFPSPGILQEGVQRVTVNPADNVSSTPCTSAVTTTSNCMPAVSSAPVFQGGLGTPSQVISSATGGSGSNVVLTVASTATYSNNIQYWVWGSSNSTMNKKWSITVNNGTTITLTGSSAVGSPGIVAGATTIAPGQTTFAIWTSGGGGFSINYSGIFLTGNCAGDTLMANGVPSSTLLNNLGNLSTQGSSQTITGSGGGGASNATITMTSTSGFLTGALYTISGNSNAAFNAQWTVTVTDGTTLTLQNSTGIGTPGTNGTVASGSTITVFLKDNWTSSGTICPSGPTIGDPIFIYAYAHPDFIQVQLGAQGQSTQLIDYNAYIQRTNSIQDGAAPFVQPGGGYTGPGTITSSGTQVTLSSPVTDTATASGITNPPSTSIQLTAGGCTGVTNGLGAWDTAGNGTYLGNVSSCNTSTDVLLLFGPVPITIANADGLSFGTAPLVGDVLNVHDGSVATGSFQSRRVVRVSPTFPSDGKVWVDYAFFPDLTARTWFFAKTAAGIACVACTSGGNSTPGIKGTGLPTGNYATVAQWASGDDNLVFLQHSYGYGIQQFDYDNPGAATSLHDVVFYDSIIGVGCGTIGCQSGSSLSPSPVMGTHNDQTTATWTTLLTNGTNLIGGYTFDNNNYALLNASGTLFNPGSNNTAYGSTINDSNYAPVSGTTLPAMRGLAGTGVPIFPWTRDGAPIASVGAKIGAMQPMASSSSVTFTPLHTYYVATTGNDGNPGTLASPWLTPNHAVVCGDVIIAAAGSYSAFGTFGTVSNCPSTTGGIDGTGGVYFATLLCGGKDLGTSGCSIPSINIAKNNWAAEGWTCNGGGTTRCFEANASASGTTIIHHVAFINDVAYNALQGYDTNDGGINHNVPGNGVDYFAVVGSIAQNAAQDAICLAAVDFVGPANYDSLAGTHLYANGVFSYSNANPACTASYDTESFMFDTLDAHGYNNQGVIENSIGFNSDRACIQFTEQSYSSAVPTLVARNNTCFKNNISTGSDFLDGEINIQLAPNPSTWNITVSNNLALQTLTTSAGGKNVNAFVAPGSVITNLSNTGNFYKAAQSACLGSFCDPGFNTASFSTAAMLGTGQTYSSPLFTNTTDLLSSQLGAPDCTGSQTVTGCMGYLPGILYTPSIISDLIPTAVGAAGKGYQLPSTSCSPNALYPTWLKGVVYLHWDGTNITERGGLVSKPCGL